MEKSGVENLRFYIKRYIKGIDNSVKLNKKISLYSVLHKIEDNTSITDDEINKLYSIWFNSALLYARRKSPSLASYLNNQVNIISEFLNAYKLSYSTVYKVDDSLLNWWSERLDLSDPSRITNYYKAGDDYLMEYNGNIYMLKMRENNFFIRTFGDSGSSLNYAYENIGNDKGYNIEICCDNKNCPHYKSSVGRTYSDGSKVVMCNLDDLRKCDQCKISGVAHPFDVEFLFEAVAYCLMHREVSSSSEKRDDYEHLPKPERVDDVVVYFGVKKEKVQLPFLKVDDIAVEKSPIPNSHASPREHYRSGYKRRAYTRKDGVKVKEAIVGSTIVNKGHTKTTYKFKERENNKNGGNFTEVVGKI